MPDHFFHLMMRATLLAGLSGLFPAAMSAPPDALADHNTHVHPGLHAQHDAPEPVVWRKAPIRILLATGEERLVHFPDSVRVALPPSLTSMLRLQSIHGTLYLRADAPFATTRVLVHTHPGGPIYVLDLEAVAAGTPPPALPDLEIVAQAPQTLMPKMSDGAGHRSPQGMSHLRALLHKPCMPRHAWFRALRASRVCRSPRTRWPWFAIARSGPYRWQPGAQARST